MLPPISESKGFRNAKISRVDLGKKCEGLGKPWHEKAIFRATSTPDGTMDFAVDPSGIFPVRSNEALVLRAQVWRFTHFFHANGDLNNWRFEMQENSIGEVCSRVSARD